MKRLRVILFVKNYLPGYKSGGPLRTIINMIESMSNEIEFLVVTSDRDLGDREPYRNVRIDQWNTVGKVQVFYASRANQSRTRLAKIVNETPHHLLYFNSLYDPIFTIPLLIARRLGALGVAPILIAPRGECLPSASKLKAWKKIPYLWMSKIFGLYTGVCWHASTDLESASIAATLGMKSAESRKRIFTALNLCCVSQLKAPESVPARSNGQPLRICFLSRICKMKNLDFALDVIDGRAGPMPASLVLVSPAIGIHRAAAAASWKRRSSRLLVPMSRTISLGEVPLSSPFSRRHRTFSQRSPPMPRFTPLRGV